MTFLEAALQVLTEAGEPLHYSEITTRVIKQGLIKTEVTTPAKTMGAQLSADCLREGSRFVRVGPGIYGLAEWQAELRSPRAQEPPAGEETRPTEEPELEPVTGEEPAQAEDLSPGEGASEMHPPEVAQPDREPETGTEVAEEEVLPPEEDSPGGEESEAAREMRSPGAESEPGEEPATPPPVEPEQGYMTYKEAAERVLAGAGQPLRYEEITERAIEKDLINPQGLTPAATMGAQLYQDIKSNGANSAFRQVGKATFGLTAWEVEMSGIIDMAAKKRRAVKQQLMQHLLAMDPGDFEKLGGRLLGAMGYENIKVTGRSADGGIDVLADRQMGILRVRTALKVKRTSEDVGPPVVMQLRGEMMVLPGVNQGMIITTSGFSEGAAEVAQAANAPLIVLIDGDGLAELLIEHGIGAVTEQVEMVRLAEDRLK
ncbi:MAG: HTH domain-containing protein [Anaerolineae bacterium]|jgi:restriction system protein